MLWKVLCLLILPTILTQLYKVKNFKLHFFKNLSNDFFWTVDLSCPLITSKKLLKSFSMHIFYFQDITKDRCDGVQNGFFFTINGKAKLFKAKIWLIIQIRLFNVDFKLLHNNEDLASSKKWIWCRKISCSKIVGAIHFFSSWGTNFNSRQDYFAPYYFVGRQIFWYNMSGR